jgi:hypothetical protein
MMSIHTIDDPLKDILAVNPEARRLFFHQKEYSMMCFFKKGADLQMRAG